ncbi:MAG: hypothetical protein NZM43_04985 [Saprospiraceae bacterium]|nr:hypothetical protein [Saprospiraceae bacterium]MDW8483663.1 hypothetical protein [Saprospiraceae bacterium]
MYFEVVHLSGREAKISYPDALASAYLRQDVLQLLWALSIPGKSMLKLLAL